MGCNGLMLIGTALVAQAALSVRGCCLPLCIAMGPQCWLTHTIGAAALHLLCALASCTQLALQPCIHCVPLPHAHNYYRGTTKETRGTAYVAYDDIYDAKTACDHLSGFNVANRYLIVLYYNPQRVNKKVGLLGGGLIIILVHSFGEPQVHLTVTGSGLDR